MKKTILIFTLLCYAITGMAQDIVIFKDGSEIQAIVQSVRAKEVLYKIYDNQDSSIYAVPRKKISIIKYENGTKDIFDASSEIANAEDVFNTVTVKQEQKIITQENKVIEPKSKVIEQENKVIEQESKVIEQKSNSENTVETSSVRINDTEKRQYSSSLEADFYNIGRNDLEMLKFLATNDVSQWYYKSFHNTCVEAKAARTTRVMGILFDVAGIAMITRAVLSKYYEDYTLLYLGGYVVVLLGEACLISGIIRGAVAGAQKSRIKNNYAAEAFGIKRAENQITPQLNFGFTQNGIGLTLNF